MEGRKEGRKDGKKDVMREGRMEGRMDGYKEGWKDRRNEGRMEGWKDGRKDGRMEGRMEGFPQSSTRNSPFSSCGLDAPNNLTRNSLRTGLASISKKVSSPPSERKNERPSRISPGV